MIAIITNGKTYNEIVNVILYYTKKIAIMLHFQDLSKLPLENIADLFALFKLFILVVLI